MYHVNVLKSLKNGKRYVGYSSKPSTVRLKEHNQGSNHWTKQNRPFKAIYEENIISKTDAIKREHCLKSGKGREFLDTIELIV